MEWDYSLTLILLHFHTGSHLYFTYVYISHLLNMHIYTIVTINIVNNADIFNIC